MRLQLTSREIATPLGPARVHVARPPASERGPGHAAARAWRRRRHRGRGPAGRGPARAGGRLGRRPGRAAVAGRRAQGGDAAAAARRRLDRGGRGPGRAAGGGCPGRSCSAAAAPGPGWPAAWPARSTAVAVVALAFPLHPPGRPERSRLAELVGGGRARADPSWSSRASATRSARRARSSPACGPPCRRSSGPCVRVVPVPGDHGLKGSAGAAADAVQEFLASRSG